MPAARAFHDFHDGADFLAPLVTRNPDHHAVADRRVVEQDRLDLGRIDVHAAGHDHVGLAVAEEEVALLVDVADVADRVQLTAAAGRVFSGSLWYSNRQ